MNRQFRLNQPQQQDGNTVTPYRACKEICNGSYTFNIPAPSPKKYQDDENEEIPTLTLDSFQRPPFVNFGKVIVGSNISKSLVIHNTADASQSLRIVKTPKPEDGFKIDKTLITLNAGQQIFFEIEWKPEKVGAVRAKIHFVTSFNEKFEAILLGNATEKKVVKKRVKRPRRIVKMNKFASDIMICEPDPSTKVSVNVLERFNEIQESAAIKIQRWWRSMSYKKEREIRRHTIVIRSSIQIENQKKEEAARKIAILNQHKAATTIQKWRREIIDKRKVQKQEQAAVVIQNWCKKIIEKRNFQKRKQAAVVIQTWWREIIDARKIQKREEAALVIQKWWKEMIVKRKVQKQEQAAVVIQIWWKSIIAARNIQKQEKAAIMIQKWWKEIIDKRKVQKQEEAAILIQNWWRTIMVSKIFHQQNEAAIMIQKWWKSIISKRKIQKIRDAATSIQKWWKEIIDKRTVQKQEEAAVVIQNWWRTIMASKIFHQQNEAAALIQNWWKTIVSKRVRMHRFAPDIICEPDPPSKVDINVLERSNEIQELASIKIQRWWRSISYKKKREIRRNTIVIRSSIQIENQKKKEVARKIAILNQHKAATTIQNWFKKIMDERKVQKAKKRASVEDAMINNNAAIKIQRWWKAHRNSPLPNSSHKKDNSPQNKDTSSLTIGARTAVAFNKLINYRKFCQLQAALSSLEATTKISPESCCKIASQSTVSTIIDIIKRSNRSEPSKLVISHAFSILLSLVKFEKTQDLVIDREALINLCIEKAKVHNKVENLFCKCLTLIYLMIVKSSKRDIIISDPKITKNMMSLISLESSFIKSRKKRKISKEIVFYPHWSSAKNVIYEFTDRSTALEHINYIFRSKLF